jgi:F0F1-type ATP synthase assembly protein I
MDQSERLTSDDKAPAAGPPGAEPSGASFGHGLALVGKATPLGMAAGGVTALMTIGALRLGLWIDRLLDTKPMFTLGLVLGSIPLSLALMIYQVRRGARTIAESESLSRKTK